MTTRTRRSTQIRVFEMVPGDIFCSSFTPASACSASPPLPGQRRCLLRTQGWFRRGQKKVWMSEVTQHRCVFRPIAASPHEWDPRQRRPDTPNTLLTCRRGGNPWRSPVCLNGDPAPVSAWGPCCSPRRATRLVCPSCALVSGGRRWDGVRTRARSHSLCLPLSLSHKHGLPESGGRDVTRSIQEAGGL